MYRNATQREPWAAALVLALGATLFASCTPPQNSRASSAIEMAEIAMFDEGLAAVLTGRPIVHRPGTVVTLEYITMGEQGETLRRWRVRALALDAALINAEPDVWQASVPDIQLKLQAEGGTVLRETGNPGLPWEAVKLMPVAEPFEIPARDEPFITTDLDGTTERAVLAASMPGGRESGSPALRVRVVASCQADVRIASDRKLELAPFAILPIPTGFRERRWVQMKGCAAGRKPAERAGPGVISLQ